MSLQGPETKAIMAYEEDMGVTYLPHVDKYPFPTGVVQRTEDKPSSTDWVSKAQKKHHAYTFLQKAVEAMKDRAAVRDTQNAANPEKQGERSMKSTVEAFNALTGHKLTEEEGWEFMILLKLVRGRQGGFRDDDYTDGAAYFGLLGECASMSR